MHAGDQAAGIQLDPMRFVAEWVETHARHLRCILDDTAYVRAGGHTTILCRNSLNALLCFSHHEWRPVVLHAMRLIAKPHPSQQAANRPAQFQGEHTIILSPLGCILCVCFSQRL